MVTDWAQHGSYRLHWQGDVLQVHYAGAWNEVAVRSLHRDIKALRQQHATIASWAMLSDLRDWEGATPEALECWWLFFEEAVSLGMTAVTDIMPSHFHELLVQSLAERAGRLTRYRHSSSPEQGLAWLVELGFSPGPVAEH